MLGVGGADRLEDVSIVLLGVAGFGWACGYRSRFREIGQGSAAKMIAIPRGKTIGNSPNCFLGVAGLLPLRSWQPKIVADFASQLLENKAAVAALGNPIKLLSIGSSSTAEDVVSREGSLKAAFGCSGPLTRIYHRRFISCCVPE